MAAPSISNFAFDKANPPAIFNSANVDVDMDIDLGQDAEIIALEADAMNIESGFQNDALPQPNDPPPSEPSLDPTDAVPEKVHIRGLDNFTSKDVKDFASEHFMSQSLVRVEWIDDTSANIIYETVASAEAALSSFSDEASLESTNTPVLQLRRAKPLSSQPHVDLYVRQATLGDIKKPHAREASRFYLLNPDKDPRERRKEHEGPRARYRDNDKRRSGRRENEPKEVAFDVNMYDDDEASLAARASTRPRRRLSRTDSISDDERRDRRTRSSQRREKDLLAGRLTRDEGGRLRNRSASPERIRDGDGTLGFDESGTSIQRIRRHSLTPPRYRSRGGSGRNSNAGKELLPSLSDGGRSTLRSLSPSNRSRELFPSRMSPVNQVKELLSQKPLVGHHRRTDAFDARSSNGDLFADRLTRSALGRSPDLPPKGSSLADRITGGPPISSGNSGKDLFVESGATEHQASFNIRGAAQQTQHLGFSIKGASESSGVRELFPTKSGLNVGKELFSSRLQGRGEPRRKAEDMYF